MSFAEVNTIRKRQSIARRGSIVNRVTTSHKIAENGVSQYPQPGSQLPTTVGGLYKVNANDAICPEKELFDTFKSVLREQKK